MTGQGLLEPGHAVVGEGLGGLERPMEGPAGAGRGSVGHVGLVGVDHQRQVVPHGLPDRGHLGHVLGQGVGVDAELDGAVALVPQPRQSSARWAGVRAWPVEA